MRNIGPNVHRISPDVPKGCAVEQAAYVVRHGSRYPDKGAYEEWVEMEEKVGIPRVHYLNQLGGVIEDPNKKTDGTVLVASCRLHGEGKPIVLA